MVSVGSPRAGAVAARPSSPSLEPVAQRERPSAPRAGTGNGADRRRAWEAAASVVDPEVPCVTVADLGILREVTLENGVAVAWLTPTYSGCPAVLAIEMAVESALRDAGFEPRVERVMSPPWTTDWITAEGREKLRAFGIAPPAEASGAKRALFGETVVPCPRCGSEDTEKVSEFGSTACKAFWRCRACAEPFDYFKCL